jgi:hypothetical protein
MGAKGGGIVLTQPPVPRDDGAARNKAKGREWMTTRSSELDEIKDWLESIDETYWFESIENELEEGGMRLVPSKMKKLHKVLVDANNYFPIVSTPSPGPVSYGIVFDMNHLTGEGSDAIAALAKAAKIVEKAGIPFSVGRSNAGYTYLNIKVSESPFVEDAPEIEEDDDEEPALS